MPKIRYFTDEDGTERALPLFVSGPGIFQMLVFDDYDAKFTRRATEWAMKEALEKLMASRGVDTLPAGNFVIEWVKDGISGKWVEWIEADEADEAYGRDKNVARQANHQH